MMRPVSPASHLRSALPAFAPPSLASADLLRDVGPPEVDPGDNKRDDGVDRYQPDGEHNRGFYRVNPAELKDRGGPAGKARPSHEKRERVYGRGREIKVQKVVELIARESEDCSEDDASYLTREEDSRGDDVGE